MDLETARRHIQSCLERMRAAYLRPVFDEWAILAAPAKGTGIAAYEGPRVEQFKQMLPEDSAPLRAGLAGKQMAEGDIEFVSDAAATRYDACVKIGPSGYLVLNNTKKSFGEIRSDPKWLSAQAALFELTEKFRSDPLELG